MLEKNKDYVEMRVSSTDCAFTQNAATTISIEGFSYDPSFRLPDPGESYVIVSKEKFEKLQESEVYYMALSTRAQYWKDKCERLQADNEHYREMAKQWEENYNLLFKKIGFDTVEELVNYLDSEAECDTLHEAIASLEYSVKFARDERRNLSKKLDECEKDYISERDKAGALQTENEQLKKKLHEFDPIPDYKELLAKLYSKDDVEKLEWTLNHICGGQVSVNGWMASAKFWKDQYEDLFKLVGFSYVKEIKDYLTNEAECDTLHEAIFKLIDENKYACEEWCKANSTNNSWKAAAECNSPKELIEKRETLEKEIEIYSRTLNEWKEGTGCQSPSLAKTLIESGMSYEYAYHESQKENRKLTDDVESWKNVTGYSTPEDYMHARISGAFHTPFDYTAAWQKATGCNAPDDVEIRIKALNERIDEAEADYNHLLNLTGFESEGEIEDALDRCDHSTLRKALVDYEFDYEELLKLTGYKSNHDIRVLLNDSEQFIYKDMRELINSLKRKAKFTESNWQKATGCDTPGRAEEKLEYYKERLSKAVQAASCASKHLNNITF